MMLRSIAKNFALPMSRSFAAGNDYDLAIIGGGPGGIILYLTTYNRVRGRYKGWTEGLEDYLH